MTANEILPMLHGVKRLANGWQALCPAHEDQRPSLSIRQEIDTLLLHCHAGCSYWDVISALGIQHRNPSAKPYLRPSAPGRTPSERIRSKVAVATYDYHDEQGKLAFQTIRYETTYLDGSKGKAFGVCRPPQPGEVPSADGRFYGLSGVAPILYRLPELIPAEFVYIVEGEKDVDTLTGLGETATCNPFGAGKWRPDYNESLRNKTVAILGDNDAPGRKHAEFVANALTGIAKEVLLIDLPGLKNKGDVSDFIAEGGTIDDLRDLVMRARPWELTPTVPAGVKSVGFSFTPLSRLLEEPTEETAFVWADTLPLGGLAICSAKPKIGKSTLARNLAVSIARGEDFLCRTTAKGRVLYLCLEEKRSEVKAHFARLGYRGDDIHIHTGATPEDALLQLELAIAEYEPFLVIIDPLSRILRVRDFNDYGSMARGLEPFVDLARRTNCAILALHHDSKIDRTGGDALLGSTALFGAVDCHIQLKKRDTGRTILTTQRYGSDMPESVVELDKETGTLTLSGDLKTVALVKSREAVLDMLEFGIKLTESDIKARVNGFNHGEISRALRSLLKDGLVCREGKGIKNDPFYYSCLPPQDCQGSSPS